MERLRSGDPEQIGPWQIVNRLGSGGMGVVYMGTNGTRAAAIKVVREFLLEDPASRTRLTREVETLLRVKSDFVAEIVGSDIDGNPAWIATNYVDGPSLKILVEKEGPLTEEKWIEFAKGFLSALSSVHAVGVVHRDIKPSNILLSKTGPKLIDFGISFVNDATSLTGTGMVAGTPAWLAPEQFLGREITTSVDNFAAGSTLMYAATGRTPWGADDSSVGAVMHTILVEEPDLSALSDFQAEIITPLLIKDVASRKTAAQMLKKLNDGPKSLSIRTKKDQKQQDSTEDDSFLALARKKDLEEKKAKQDAIQKEKEAARLAKEKEAEEAQKQLEREKSRLAKEQERERSRQAKEQEKLAKEREKAERKAANGAAKKAKQDLRAQAKTNSKAKGDYSAPKFSGKQRVIAAVVAGIAVLGISLITLVSTNSGSKQEPVDVVKTPEFTWSALISGESKAQTGNGTTFEVFVCDQNVIVSSVEGKNISTRSPSAGPLSTKVIKGDKRCGKAFDTIVVSAQEPEAAGSVNYFVAGKTSSNFDFRYDFSVTVLPK
jgi:serine/threonine protein kinase